MSMPTKIHDYTVVDLIDEGSYGVVRLVESPKK